MSLFSPFPFTPTLISKRGYIFSRISERIYDLFCIQSRMQYIIYIYIIHKILYILAAANIIFLFMALLCTRYRVYIYFSEPFLSWHLYCHDISSKSCVLEICHFWALYIQSFCYTCGLIYILRCGNTTLSLCIPLPVWQTEKRDDMSNSTINDASSTATILLTETDGFSALVCMHGC